MNSQVSQNQQVKDVKIHKMLFGYQFVTLPNCTAQDPNLSFSAKGFLLHVMSLPDDWTLNVFQMAEEYKGPQKGNGRKAIHSILDELKRLGYVKYEKFRNSAGQWGHRYDIYPITEANFHATNPHNPPGFQKISPEIPERYTVKADTVKGDIYKENKHKKTFTKKTSILNPPPLTPPNPLHEAAKAKFESFATPVSLRSEEEDFSIFKILEDTNLSPRDKKRLSTSYSEAEVANALKISQAIPIKRSLMGLLCDIIKNPGQYTRDHEPELKTSNKHLSEKYNERLSKISPKLAKENLALIEMGCIKLVTPSGEGIKVEQVSLKATDFMVDLSSAKKYVDTVLLKQADTERRNSKPLQEIKASHKIQGSQRNDMQPKTET